MITYVNTVFVNNTNKGAVISAAPATTDKDKFVIYDIDKCSYVAAPKANENKRIKIGLVTSKTTVCVDNKTGKTTIMPVIKWSNVINHDDIKSFNSGAYAAPTNPEDKVTIDFTNLDANVLELFKEGGKRLIVRLTFKDLPTRFRKWTESYEYTPLPSDTVDTIAANMANVINKAYKRARVTADGTSTAKKLVITALPYDDDNSVDTINVENKVRFSANIYYTNPDAAGFASKNKYFPTGVEVKKIPGEKYKAEAKFVRDREAQAMGYDGILNRGCCTWPIIKPAMVTDLNAHYDYATLEFENMYRTADDLQRRTKQTVEIYSVGGSTGIIAALKTWATDTTASDNHSLEDEQNPVQD